MYACICMYVCQRVHVCVCVYNISVYTTRYIHYLYLFITLLCILIYLHLFTYIVCLHLIKILHLIFLWQYVPSYMFISGKSIFTMFLVCAIPTVVNSVTFHAFRNASTISIYNKNICIKYRYTRISNFLDIQIFELFSIVDFFVKNFKLQ